MESVNIHYAKTNLSKLIERVQAGEEIVISNAGKPVARLSGLMAPAKPRKLGILKGKFEVTPDFDMPLPDEIQRAFNGSAD